MDRMHDDDNQLIVGESGQPAAKSAVNEEPRVQRKFLFKSGDDLRQDNLVLQFFKIMDRLWQKGKLEMQMICYEVMESGHETGYIEFVDDAQVITRMHWDKETNAEQDDKDKKGYAMSRMGGPFDKQSVMKYVLAKCMTREKFTRAPDMKTVRERVE